MVAESINAANETIWKVMEFSRLEDKFVCVGYGQGDRPMDTPLRRYVAMRQAEQELFLNGR